MSGLRIEYSNIPPVGGGTNKNSKKVKGLTFLDSPFKIRINFQKDY